MKVKFALTIFLTRTLFCSNIIGQSINKATLKTSIDSFIERKMIETGIVGIGASIIIDKKVVWTNGYGYADKENKTSFTPSTVMNIASISKTFTGVCNMKPVEEGKVSLDEDINNYLPFKVINPNFPGEKITLRHLATHTSGLTDRNPFYGDSTYYYGGLKPEPLGAFLKSLLSAVARVYRVMSDGGHFNCWPFCRPVEIRSRTATLGLLGWRVQPRSPAREPVGCMAKRKPIRWPSQRGSRRA